MESTQGATFRQLILALTAGRDRPQFTAAIALGVLVSIAGAAAFTGVVRTYYYGHDIFQMLDGAWRFLCGQRPHIDYYSPWGPAPFIIFGAGLKLAGNSVEGFGYGLAISSFTLGTLAWIVCRRRTFPVVCILASATVALLTAAPFPLGFRPSTLSHAMSYNRLGYALAGIVFLEAFGSPLSNNDALIGGIISGACCAVALFNKASFFGVGLAVIAASIPFARERTRFLGLACGFAAVSLPVFAYLHFDFRDMITDLTIAGSARSSSLSGWGTRWAIFDALPSFLPLFVAALLLTFGVARSRSPRVIERYAPVVGSLLALLGGALLLLSNAQPGGYPLTGLFALVICNQALRSGVERMPDAPYYCAIVAIAAVTFLPGFAADAAGAAYGLMQRVKAVPPDVERFHQPQLSKLILMNVPADSEDWEIRSNGAAYVNYVNDGVDLIERNTQPSESVMDFDCYDPFPYALLRKPPKGGFIGMSLNKNYTEARKPSAERLFGNVDVVMFPKFPSAPERNVSGLDRNYGAYLRMYFRPCVESARWVLYRRRSSPASCPIEGHP